MRLGDALIHLKKNLQTMTLNTTALKTHLFFCLIFVLPVAATAQYNSYSYSSSYYNNITGPAYQSSQLLKNQARNKLAQLNQETGSTSKSPDKSQEKSTDTLTSSSNSQQTLPYKRDRELSEKIKAEFLQDVAKQRPQEIDDITLLLKTNDPVDILAKFIKRQGLDSSSMEGFVAFWYGQSWAVANQKQLPTARQYQGIYKQLSASTTSEQLWAKMGNREKQVFFEKLTYPLLVQKAIYQAYTRQGNNNSIAKMASFTQEGLKKFGLDLQHLTLSDDGFNGL
jgi:hypothetical protein